MSVARRNCPVLLISVLSVASGAAAAATFTVTSANDSGGGSLRAAIAAANISPTANDRIEFAIPGSGVHRISLASALPAITGKLTIDGYTQAGASPNTLADGDDAVLTIELDGSGIPASNTDPVGLLLEADDCVVQGLSILGFFHRENINIVHGAGIRVSAADNAHVVGNWIGLAADGATALANGAAVEIVDSTNAVIGASASLGDRNLLTGNGSGVNVLGAASSGADIKNNYVGLLPGGNSMPQFSPPGDAIVCSGNCYDGIFVFNASANAIGGFDNDRNVIGGGNTGIRVLVSDGNFIVNNVIGLGIDGTTPLEVFETGIDIYASADNTVGGLLGSGGNRIAHVLNGIRVGNFGSPNALYGNLVYAFRPTNQGNLVKNRAIDLYPSTTADGLTANDPDDADNGANHLQNFPVITSAVYDAGGHLDVAGTLDVPAAAAGQYRIEAFLTDACGSNDVEPQPKQLVALQLVSLTGSQESFEFSVSLAQPTMTRLTVTASTPGATPETSEQSPCVALTIDRIFADGFD